MMYDGIRRMLRRNGGILLGTAGALALLVLVWWASMEWSGYIERFTEYEQTTLTLLLAIAFGVWIRGGRS